MEAFELIGAECGSDGVGCRWCDARLDFLHAAADLGDALGAEKRGGFFGEAGELKRVEALLFVAEIVYREAEVGEFLELFLGELVFEFPPALAFKANPFPLGFEQEIDLRLGERAVIHMQGHAQVEPIDPVFRILDIDLDMASNLAVAQAGELGIQLHDATRRTPIEPCDELVRPFFAGHALLEPYPVSGMHGLFEGNRTEPLGGGTHGGFVELNQRINGQLGLEVPRVAIPPVRSAPDQRFFVALEIRLGIELEKIRCASVVTVNPALDIHCGRDALNFFLHVRGHGNAQRGECTHALTGLHGLRWNDDRPLRAFLSKRPNGNGVNRTACHILERSAGKNRDRGRWHLAVRIQKQELVIICRAFRCFDLPTQWLVEKPDRLAVFPHDMSIEEILAGAELGEAFGKTGTHSTNFEVRDGPVVILSRL